MIATRSRLMARLPGRGAMALLELDPESAEALIADYPELTVAVYASPHQTVIAGPPERVDAVIAVVSGAGPAGAAHRGGRRLAPSDHRSDTVRIAGRACRLDAEPPRIPVISTPLIPVVPLLTPLLVVNLRNPVRFSAAVASAGAEHGTFVEISPHPC